MTSEQILNLLAVKHSGDVFVPECKSGSTHYSQHDRIDAWVMPKSWAHPDVTGYEIKVSRSDFLRDDKWRRYLDLCNLLYFVAPRKLIDPAELPAEVGLIEVSGTGSRLMTRRKAIHRDVKIPESVWRYVLMCRSQITRESAADVDRATFWRRWLAERESDRTLGREVGGRIARLYAENVETVRQENARLSREIEGITEAKKILAELGVDTLYKWGRERQIRQAVREAATGCSEILVRRLEAADCAIRDLQEIIAKDLSIPESAAKAETIE